MMRSLLVLASVAMASATGHSANTKCITIEDIVLKGGMCDGIRVGSFRRCAPPMEAADVTALATQMGDGSGVDRMCAYSMSSMDRTCPMVGGEAKDTCDTGKADYCKIYAAAMAVETCSKDADCPQPKVDTNKKPCCSNYKALLNIYCTKVDSAQYILFVSDP